MCREGGWGPLWRGGGHDIRIHMLGVTEFHLIRRAGLVGMGRT